jgi:hypothetical protein
MSTVDELTRHLKELAARAAVRVFPPAPSNVVSLAAQRETPAVTPMATRTMAICPPRLRYFQALPITERHRLGSSLSSPFGGRNGARATPRWFAFQFF